MHNTIHRHPQPTRERGVVLIFTLIVVLILTIGAVALVRSMRSSLFSAGTLAFRRDLVNQGEQAVSNVLASVIAGTFVNPTTASLQSANYSAQILTTNAQGVPVALLSDAGFLAMGSASNDIAGATPDIKIRYVIDRMCSTTGPASSILCVQATAVPPGGTAGNANPIAIPPSGTVYRLSVRVTDARSTQIFLQTTFTQPD